jgi:HK97 gp10 family phage protein
LRVTKNIRVQDLAMEISLIPQNFTEASEMTLQLPRVVSYAKALCPVQTGALRDSIRVENPRPYTAKLVAGGGRHVNALTGKVVDYARHVHDGTSRMPARPFLAQALLSEKLNIARDILYSAAGVTR